MTMTVQNVTDMMREIMNSVGSTQWSDATLTNWAGLAHWQLYANILNAQRHYRMQQVTVSEDSNGQFLLSSLNTGSGDTTKYAYRILSVSQPAAAVTSQVQFFYKEVDYELFPNPQPNTSLPYVWYLFGDSIQVLPVASGQQLTITTSWRPPSVAMLSGSSVTVDFPAGYEPLIAWRGCQLALVKGGSETGAAQDIKYFSDQMENQMLLDLGRKGSQPIIAKAMDMAEDWGGGSF